MFSANGKATFFVKAYTCYNTSNIVCYKAVLYRNRKRVLITQQKIINDPVNDQKAECTNVPICLVLMVRQAFL